MNEYRCTRNQPYQNPRCFGFTDLQARQGYYIKATSEEDAITKMTQLYPDDTAGFSAHLWKTKCPVCRGKGYQTPLRKRWDGRFSELVPVVCDLCLGAGEAELTVIAEYRDYIGV